MPKYHYKKQIITITIRSSYGDTDIVILVISLLWKFSRGGTLGVMVMEKNRKKFRTSNVDIDLDVVDVLIGFHPFSGNYDYISSFFRKGKIICFKTFVLYQV